MTEVISCKNRWIERCESCQLDILPLIEKIRRSFAGGGQAVALLANLLNGFDCIEHVPSNSIIALLLLNIYICNLFFENSGINISNNDDKTLPRISDHQTLILSLVNFL